MKNSLVILVAVIVAVVSAGRLPEANSRPSLGKLEPVLQKIIDHVRESRSGLKSEDVFENELVPEDSQPKEVNDSVEEFRQKPMNWKALIEKLQYLTKQQQSATEKKDIEDSEDSDVFLSYGLDKPVKIDEVKNEIDGDEDEEEQKSANGVVEEAIDMTKEDNPDVLISYGLAEPIEALDMKKNIIEEEDDDDDDKDEKENESIIPFGDITDKDEEELDNEDIQVSFGLAEPIEAAAAKKINQQDDSDSDEDDDEEDDEKPSDLNEKVMSEVISNVLAKFAKAYNVKL